MKFIFNLSILTIFVYNVSCLPSVSTFLKCPRECVCQYAHFMDLPLSRWIHFMQVIRQNKSIYSQKYSQETGEEKVSNNEVLYEENDQFGDNPFIRQATCILQIENDLTKLISQLPVDLEALVLLYTSESKNKTVATSIFQPLLQLATLEIRGPLDRSFRLIIDEPMTFLKHANFESISLFGSEDYKRPKNPVHPRESFDYVPSSEQAVLNISLKYEREDEDVDIVPYEIYIKEIQKSRMPTFYGWKLLKVLRINQCKLDEMHWEMFDGLLQLQHLSLERNEIKIVPAFALYGAMHIKTLSLAHNFILDLNYRSLAGLLELEVLNLSNNNLTKLSELSFPPFPKLKYVDFSHNPIRYIFPAAFGVMNNTRTMHLGSKETAAELWNNGPFESLQLLTTLTITNVSIGRLEHEVFQHLSSLEKLNLKGQIRSIEFDAFSDMSKLIHLNLSVCNIKAISMDAFFGCNKLEVIDLSHNNLSFIPPGLFDDQLLLREIYLQSNNLKFLPSTFFYHPSLKLVRLTENTWKCTCEMTLWKQKLTNQLRSSESERCISDYKSGKQLSCQKVINYKFDKTLSPRCSNFNGHSVYYALRKDITCNLRKEVNNLRKYHNLHTYQPMSKYNKLGVRRSFYQDKIKIKRKEIQKQMEGIVVPWSQTKAHKMPNTMANNNLQYFTEVATRKNKSQEVANDIFAESVNDQFELYNI